MPIPATAKWPKPRSEDEFEDMAVDFLRIRWEDPNAVRNGRRGQRQHGVDIVGHPSWAQGKTAGAQCKNVESLTLEIVKAEAEKAKTFPGGLVEFKMVTAAERDAGLQAAVRAHFRANPAGFDVEVVFWPDVVADLSSDERLVAKYWKGFQSSPSDTGWRPPPPSLIHRANPGGESWSEWQYEMALWSQEGAGLDTSELAFEVEALAREGLAGPVGSVLVSQKPVDGEGGLKWSFDQKPYRNVHNKWELEVREHGFVAYRWGEWTHGSDRWCGILPFVDGVVLPISLHKKALLQIGSKVGVPSSTKFVGRVSAHGDGPLKLNDDGPLTTPAPRVTAPESAADWSVELEADHSASPVENGARLLNRALAKFTFSTIGQYFGRTPESRFLRIDEVKLRSIYGQI